ncbi:hypothetical protein Syun_011809 [Stephania yunnanensis]|uniref:Neprosin PEP catalytic domain-containing protein n=1 Tax=Stephania yunnanensis TaxID=152371 RepID=A0AAP0JYZ5_9MAGN
MFQDNGETRLFVHWATTGSTGCFNTYCSGFMVTNKSLPPTIAFKNVSVYGGTKFIADLLIDKSDVSRLKQGGYKGVGAEISVEKVDVAAAHFSASHVWVSNDPDGFANSLWAGWMDVDSKDKHSKSSENELHTPHEMHADKGKPCLSREAKSSKHSRQSFCS